MGDSAHFIINAKLKKKLCFEIPVHHFLQECSTPVLIHKEHFIWVPDGPWGPGGPGRPGLPRPGGPAGPLSFAVSSASCSRNKKNQTLIKNNIK